MMIEDHFHAVAAAQGWSRGTCIAVLLEYIAGQHADDVFAGYLAGRAEPEADDPVDAFMWDVAGLLQHAGLSLDPAFQLFCANGYDLFTPDEAAAEWRRRTAA